MCPRYQDPRRRARGNEAEQDDGGVLNCWQLVGGENENDKDSGTSSGENGVWRRDHVASRRSLFTPSGLPGSPRRPSSLLGRRMTEGVYDDDELLVALVVDESSEEVIIVDDWNDLRQAHRRPPASGTGTTTFEVNCSRRFTGSCISVTDEASGPAEDHDEERKRAGRAGT